MSIVKCPICGKVLEYLSLSDCPYFPFCSERCKWADLGNWFDGVYRFADRNGDTPGPEGKSR